MPRGIGSKACVIICATLEPMSVAGVKINSVPFLYYDDQHAVGRVARHVECAATAQIEAMLLVCGKAAARARREAHACE